MKCWNQKMLSVRTIIAVLLICGGSLASTQDVFASLGSLMSVQRSLITQKHETRREMRYIERELRKIDRRLSGLRAYSPKTASEREQVQYEIERLLSYRNQLIGRHEDLAAQLRHIEGRLRELEQMITDHIRRTFGD